MANIPLKIYDRWVNISGETVAPRVVWLMDRVGKPAISALRDFGFRDDDQLVVFDDGRYSSITYYLQMKMSCLSDARAIVFLMTGMDHLARDVTSAEEALDPSMAAQMHESGPRQVPNEEVPAVVAAYERAVALAIADFPGAMIFSSNPAPRRSGAGFAVNRAIQVTGRMTRQHPRHHHFSILRKFYGRKMGKKGASTPGGRYPVYERFFESNGVNLTKLALAGAIVRAHSFVDSFVSDDDIRGAIDPLNIPDLKMFF